MKHLYFFPSKPKVTNREGGYMLQPLLPQIPIDFVPNVKCTIQRLCCNQFCCNSLSNLSQMSGVLYRGYVASIFVQIPNQIFPKCQMYYRDYRGYLATSFASYPYQICPKYQVYYMCAGVRPGQMHHSIMGNILLLHDILNFI